LVEGEGATQTQLTLRVSPRLGEIRPARVRDEFLRELRGCYGGSLASRTWRHADGFKVRIAEPHATLTGKVLPLHLLRAEPETPRAS
jgi:hypothetical protein